MDEYQHPLFFEASDLTDREKEKIRRHFQKRRNSGGGDCGIIKKAGGKTYRICFKEKEDQERVLQRKFHTILLPSGELCLTVRQTKSLHNPDQPSTSQSQGPAKEVQTAAAKLDDLNKRVKEKRVILPTDLLTFITSSSAISKYQTHFQQSLRNPVSLEVGSELVLSSLSFDALDEAMSTVLRDLSVANVQLHGATAVPPELDRVKEIMIKAKNEENCQELRVDISFIPGPSGTRSTKVQLVGYSENVNKLKEVLHDYQMNQVGTKEVLKLPHPELVDCFDKILDLTGKKQTKMTLKASNFPYPCVLVSGPRCLVQEAQTDLNAALASLTSDTLVLDGPGAQRYFKAEGKVAKELVESSCQVLIKEQQGLFIPNVKSSSTSVSVGPRRAIRNQRTALQTIRISKTSLEMKLDSWTDEQVNVLEVPMLTKKLTSPKIVPVPQLPYVQQQQQLVSSVNTNQSSLCTTSTSQQSVFLFVGLSKKNIDDAMTKLKDLYQAQCSTKTFKKGELAGLSMNHLKQLVETHGLHMQMDQSGQGSLTVSGLKDGVNQVMQMINTSLHSSLKREVRVREEEDLYTRVAWCILGHNSTWERLPKPANHNLEKKDIAGGIVDAQGIQWSVDLQRLEATSRMYQTRQTAKLKRLVNLPDFTLPLYWDNMADGEDFKKVVLQPSSAEYRTVEEAFKRTVSQTVMKIECLQNVHLRRVYEAQKKHIADKNRQEGGAGEKLLYHGTTQDNCDSIMKTGFNRRFAGQNATAYGHGTYFAVNASYSAQPTYSKPTTDGTQLMFVARVLTGVYTPGQSNMRVPPPRSVLQPHDRYDSVVDKTHNPNMFVVFHDNQAYPDYLITFK